MNPTKASQDSFITDEEAKQQWGIDPQGGDELKELWQKTDSWEDFNRLIQVQKLQWELEALQKLKTKIAHPEVINDKYYFDIGYAVQERIVEITKVNIKE